MSEKNKIEKILSYKARKMAEEYLASLKCNKGWYEAHFNTFNQSLQWMIDYSELENPLSNFLNKFVKYKKNYEEATDKLIELGINISNFPKKLNYLEVLN